MKKFAFIFLLFSQIAYSQDFYSIYGVTDSTVYLQTTVTEESKPYKMVLEPYGQDLTIDEAKVYIIERTIEEKEEAAELQSDAIKNVVEGHRLAYLLKNNLGEDYYISTFNKFSASLVGSWVITIDGQEVEAQSMKNSDGKIIFNATIENFSARLESSKSFTVLSSNQFGRHKTFYLIREKENEVVYSDTSGRIQFKKQK